MKFSKYQKLMSLGNSLQERRMIKKMIIETSTDGTSTDTDAAPKRNEPDKNKAKEALGKTKDAFVNTEGLADSIKAEADNIIDQILDSSPAELAITAGKFKEQKVQPSTPAGGDVPGDQPSRDGSATAAGGIGSNAPRGADAGDGNAAAAGADRNTTSATIPGAESRFEKWRKSAAGQLGKIGKSLGDKFRGSPGSNPQSDDDEPGTAPGNRRRAQAGVPGGRGSSAENEAREIIRGREALSFIDEYGLEKMKKLMDDKKIDVRIIIL